MALNRQYLLASVTWVKPWHVRLLAIVLGGLMLVSMIFYGVSVCIEQQVLRLGHETRDLHEDNQGLQIELDKIRAYAKIAKVSATMQGLQHADEIIDVAQKPLSQLNLSRAPIAKPNTAVYGY